MLHSAFLALSFTILDSENGSPPQPVTDPKSELNFPTKPPQKLLRSSCGESAGVVRPSLGGLTTSRPRPPTGRPGTVLRLWRTLPHIHALSFLNVKLYFGNGDKPVGDAKISGSRVSPVSYLCASDGLARRLTPADQGVRRSGWLSSKYGDRTRAWRAPCRAVRTTRRVR